MKKFNNKYRIESTRMQNWDYAWKGSYFITICSANREYFFGDILDGKMELTAIGKIVRSEWLRTFEMRPDMNLTCGEFVIMPDHFHAIITIGKNQYNRADRNAGRDTNRCRVAMHCVPTMTTNQNKNQPKNKFGAQSKNLASIVRGFKSSVTKNARRIQTDFAWQSGYHDHLIRNDQEYKRIKYYIINNPKKWENDKFR